MTTQEKYKKELLDKYLNKNLSNDERHELERLALDDPFLFEALNGFAQAGEEHVQDISKMRKKIMSGQAQKKRFSIIPYGVAASLLVVVGLSFWLMDSGNVGSDNQMAEVASSADTDKQGDIAEAEVLNTVKDLDQNESKQINSTKLKKVAKEQVEEVELGQPQDSQVRNSKMQDELAELSQEPEVRSTPVMDGVPVVSKLPTTPVAEEESGMVEYVKTIESDMKAEEDVVLEEAVFNESMPAASKPERASEGSFKDNIGKGRAMVDSDDVIAATSRKKEVNRGALPTMQENVSLSPFDVHFIGRVRDRLTLQEQSDINTKVELQFSIIEGVISEFKAVPSQGERIDGILKEIVESGSTLLVEQNALLVVYDIGF